MIDGLKPTRKRVLAQRDDNAYMKGFYIPEEYRENNQFATVVAVGNDVPDIEVGDRIVTKKFYGEGIALTDNYFIIMEEEILGYIKKNAS